MHMKYFQSIGRIKSHYDDILIQLDRPKSLPMLFEHLGIELKDKEILREEYEVLRYLLGCQLMLVRDANSKKPALEAVQSCFTRHLSYLEKTHNCHAYNVNKHVSTLIRKEYKACRHYLFQFSLPAWYEKLPDEVLTFENKYPDFEF